MSKDPTTKKAPVEKAEKPKKTARVSHPDALERVKNALLSGSTASPEAEREVEADYREQFQHHIVPTPLEIVLELANLTDEERDKLERLKAGEVVPVREGGAGAPVGPQGEAEAQAMQTRRPGDVVPESTNTPATEQEPEPPARFAVDAKGTLKATAGPKAGTKAAKTAGKDFGKATPEKSLKRIGAKKAKRPDAKRKGTAKAKAAKTGGSTKV